MSNEKRNPACDPNNYDGYDDVVDGLSKHARAAIVARKRAEREFEAELREWKAKTAGVDHKELFLAMMEGLGR